jgi:hypothetical protein
LSDELIGEALGQARVRSTLAQLSEQERHELAETLVLELAEGHELPDELGEQLLDELLGALIAGKRGEREILGQDGVLGQLTRRVVERRAARGAERASRLSGGPGARRWRRELA